MPRCIGSDTRRFQVRGALEGVRTARMVLITYSDSLTAGWESYMKKYDDEEKRREKLKQDKDILHAKISTARYPLQKLDINYGQNKGKQYSEDEDRFLLVRLNHYGLERDYAYDMMKRDIGEWPDFR